MDPGLLTALVGAGAAVVGAAVGGPLAAGLVGRRLRAAQAAQHAAQAKQLQAEAARISQDVYQQITQYLRAELDRARSQITDLREALRITSTEEERLRVRVTALESRLAQLTTAEAGLAAELRRTQGDRDRLREVLAARDATITALRGQVEDLTAQLTLARTAPPA
jgi:chromosome segregation ATPase